MTASGILLALLPALAWGSQAICIKKIGGKFTNKMMGIVWSLLLVGIFIYFIKRPVITTNLIIGSLLSGIFWSIGMILEIKSFDLVGVAMTMPIFTGEQLIGTALIGAIFLHEWTSSSQWLLGIAALVIIIAGIAMTAYHENSGEKGNSKNIQEGLLVMLLSAIGWIGYATFPQLFHLNGWDVIFPQAIAMFISTFIIVLCQKDNQMWQVATWKNMLTGALFEIGNISILFSNAINGIAVGFTFSQLNVVISTLGGLLILHESKTSKELKMTIAGLILVVAGAMLIGITKK